MMWPRLQLLRELLAEDGVIFVSIDDHEQWRLLGIMEEVFGENNHIDTLVHVHNKGAVSGKHLREVNEFVHVFSKDSDAVRFGLFERELATGTVKEDELGNYRHGSGLLRIGMSGTPEDRPNLHFPIFVRSDGSFGTSRKYRDDVEVLPKDGQGNPAVWRWSREKVDRDRHNLELLPHSRTKFQFVIKIRPDEQSGQFLEKPSSLWDKPRYSSATGTNGIKRLFEGERRFDFPKSSEFVKDLLQFSNVGPDDIVLDSFAGSGTTAHAVLALNKEDGGNRKFILVECEDYADTITAERVRRVIRGVPNAKDAGLRDGLDGEFTYCTLGDPITVEGLLSGDSMPAFDQLAAYLICCATGAPVKLSDLITPDDAEFDGDTSFVYETDRQRFHLFYRPEKSWLTSNEGALNSERAEQISRDAKLVGKSAVVFGPVRYMNSSDLRAHGITFCQLPYELSAARAKLG